MLRATEGVNTVWLFFDAAHVIFEEAKKRVYTFTTSPNAAAPAAATHARKLKRPASHKVVPVLEQPAKWEYLKQVLEEIQQDRSRMLQQERGSQSPMDEGEGGSHLFPILILTQEKLLCTQLGHLLVMGGKAIMKDAFDQYLEWRSMSSSAKSGGGGGGGGGGAG